MFLGFYLSTKVQLYLYAQLMGNVTVSENQENLFYNFADFYEDSKHK